MKKLFTLLLAGLLGSIYFQANSQIKITQDDLAPAGTFLISALDTGNLDSITMGDAGENVTWDFSMLQNTAVDTVKILHPDDTPFGTSFPQSNKVVQEYGALYYYLKASSSSIDAIGLGGNFTDMNIEASAPLSPVQTYLQFPSTYQTSYNDVSAFQFNVYVGMTIPYQGSNITVDSAKFIRKITKDVLYDGYGNTITPLGSFPSIREKSIETNHDSVLVKVVTQFGTFWSPFPIIDTTTITVHYRYWAKEIGYSLVNLTTDTSGRIQTAGYLFTKPEPIAGPVANFTVNTNTPVVGDTVFFKDLSLGAPDTWLWDFGDATDEVVQSPYHIYTDIGIYAVTLIIANPNGADTLRKEDYISVSMPPVKASFIFEISDFKVKFTDQSQNIIPAQTTWRWDFGDSSGYHPTGPNPVYPYDDPGTYNVCVTVNNSLTKDSTCRSVKVPFNSGVEDRLISKKPYWSLTPNPSDGEFHLFNIEKPVPGIKSLNLYNSNGKMIYHQTFLNNDITVSGGTFQKSLYFYRITNNKGTLLQSGKWLKL